jgi:hypothetical protein
VARKILDEAYRELQLSRLHLGIWTLHLGEVRDFVGMVERLEVEPLSDRSQEHHVSLSARRVLRDGPTPSLDYGPTQELVGGPRSVSE